jgi:hypothetical protein
MLIRIMSRWWGDFDEEHGIWHNMPVGFVCAMLSMFYWLPFVMLCIDRQSLAHTMVVPTIGTMIIGFVLSAFSGVRSRESRLYAMALHTVLLPGFLLLIALVGVGFGLWKLIAGLLKIQDGLLFVQDMLSGGLTQSLKARQERKRAEQDAKLKLLADKVRVSGEGYRMAYAACNECGQVLPENEDDGREDVRSAG